MADGVEKTNWPLASMIQELSDLEAEERAAAEAEREAKEHRKGVADRVQDHRECIRELMQSAGIVQDATDLARVSVVKTPAKLKIDDPELIPGEFYDMEPSLNNTRLKARIASGMAVAGAHLEQAETLKVEWKK